MFNNRADLESFFKWGGRLWYVLLFIILMAIVAVAHADESKVKMYPMPVICMEKEEFRNQIKDNTLTMIWQGMREEKELVTLWRDVTEGHWFITAQEAGNPLVCIISFGDKEGLVGEEAQL